MVFHNDKKRRVPLFIIMKSRCGIDVITTGRLIISRRLSDLFYPMCKSGVLWLLALLLSGFCGFVTAEPLVLENSQKKYELGYHLDVLEDKDAKWTLNDVLSSPVSDTFERSDSIAPSFGFTSSAIWVRFQIRNIQAAPKSLLLQMDFPLLEGIQFYSPTTDGYSVKKAGIEFPFDHRGNTHRTHVFEVELDANSDKTYYMRIQGDETIQLPLLLWEPDALEQHETYEQYGLGVYYGIIVAMCLYNFFLFLFIRDKSYLYYVIYISCLGLFAFSQNGLAFQFLWPDSPAIAKWFNPVGCGATLISVILFTRHFLQTKNYTPFLDRLLKLEIPLVGLIYVFVALSEFQISAAMAGASSIAIIVTIIAASLSCLRQGYLPARYFLIAFASVIVGAFLYALKSFGLIPSFFASTYGIQIGSSLEVVLLSLGLASRINTLKQEKSDAEQQALEAALSANRLKDSFMSTITHELLTPINGIQLSLSLLDRGVREDERKEFLATANNSTQHLLNLVESMFAFSEARRGTMQLAREKLDLHRMVAGIVVQFEDVIDRERVKLTLNWDEDTPHWVWGDKTKLSMMISQLLKNSCTYTNEGEVALDCSIVENKNKKNVLMLTIRDTGIGISEDVQSQIFEGFTQADSSINRKYGGMGIGLSILRDILFLMQGTMKFESVVNKGTTFTLSIPIEILDGGEIIPLDDDTVYEVRGRRSKQAKILVVEDNPVNMKLLCKVLEKSNYIPLSAIHGKEALTLLEKNPDVVAVLMDCQMPVMDGFEATRQIRKFHQFHKLPIIAVTANISQRDQQQCMDVGMSDYLAKPVKGKNILAILAKWLKA